MASSACPCCRNGSAEFDRTGLHLCPGCGHRWRDADPLVQSDHYSSLAGRNAVSAGQRERKFTDRMSTIAPLLRDGLRILEIGCAEGELGGLIKARARVHYTGVEPSRDSERAAVVLDRVVRDSKALGHARYDLILAFHVLEHLPDVAAEVARLRKLIEPSGALVVEVPEEAGHRCLTLDKNPEHLHFFSAASLAAIAGHARFIVDVLTAQHFESAVYRDSLRMLARPRADASQRRAALLQAFRQRLGGAFAVYGIGGDYANYVEPLIGELTITALIDSNTDRHGEKRGEHTIEGLDPVRHGSGPILIASIRFADEVRTLLIARGVAAQNVVSLADIFDRGA